MNSLNKLLVSSVSCSSSVLLSPAVVSLFSLSVKHFVTLLRKVKKRKVLVVTRPSVHDQKRSSTSSAQVQQTAAEPDLSERYPSGFIQLQPSALLERRLSAGGSQLPNHW